MSLAAGALSQVTVSSNAASLLSAAATGGTGPYTYQWYQSTTTGFSPGGGNIVAGATSLSQSFTGLVPNVTYFYKVVVTDTGNSNTTATSSQLAVVTTAQQLSQNQFAQSQVLGTLDQQYNYNTHSVQIDSSQSGVIYAGQAVKRITTQTGVNSVPKVVACTANTDLVMGYINYDIKSISFAALSAAEISMAGNVMYLYSTTAIDAGAQVTLDLLNGGVAAAVGGNTIVGTAYDGATAAGQLIRVYLTCLGIPALD